MAHAKNEPSGNTRQHIVRITGVDFVATIGLSNVSDLKIGARCLYSCLVVNRVHGDFSIKRGETRDLTGAPCDFLA